jgi:hypothetical protein
MRLDQTSIAIRERPTLEIFDLATKALVRHFAPLMTLLVLNALPFIIIDWCLIGWMADSSYSQTLNVAYYWAMGMLIVSQAQAGTFLITIYLGRVMFMKDGSLRSVLRQTWHRDGAERPKRLLDRRPLLRYIWSQGFLRLGVFAVGTAFLIFGQQEDTEVPYVLTYMLLSAVVATGYFVRAARPYTTEIWFLEQTPLKESATTPSFRQRSRSLHLLGAGMLANRFFTVAIITLLLLLVMQSTLVVADTVLSIRANLESTLQPYYFLIAAWFVAGFMAIVRFLFYIDLRIRQEGWAVQLRFMAENNQLLEQLNN